MFKIINLKIEGLKHNCVTDKRPNISFALESDISGEFMKSASITVGGWHIETTEQINRYTGPMEPFTEYSVKVHAVGSSGEKAAAETTFSTGRLDIPWLAQWITDSSYDFPAKISPLPMTFRKSIRITQEISHAWINVTALGVYELHLNGKKVGEDYFAPGFTSYNHQIQYQTYDVTNQLNESNKLIAVVAGGWAVGSFNYIRKNKISADRQAFLLELHVKYKDGSSEIFYTDESWQVSEDGNYRMAEWYDGEIYDSTINPDSIKWKAASITKPRKTPVLLAQYGDSVRVQEVLKPIDSFLAASGEVIYDFGQNFAGVISAEINGKHGQKIIFRHAEVLFEGELFVKSLRTAKATATYICNDGKQHYSPRLTYMGFRYVGVSDIHPDELKLEALVLHSDFEEIGSFECSNEMINQLQSNIRWGGKSNLVDIPTDCPQRDERQGWTGDLAMFASTACYNFNLSRFIDKWLRDLKAEQGRGGGIPMVVPRCGDKWPVMATSAWGDSCIIVPWNEYMARGDIEILKENYPVIKKFLKAAEWWSGLMSIGSIKRHIWRFPFHFGDWCAPDEDVKQWLAKGRWVGTAFFSNSCRIAAEIADLLDKPADAVYYRNLREKIIKAYRKVFTDGKGNLKKEFQTAYVLPLHFNMVVEDEAKVMTDNLVRLVREADNHLTTGFTGTPYLLFALSDNGRSDVAYDLLLQDSSPSWLYEVRAGATTIWERWDALRLDGTINIGDLTGKKSDEESGGGMVSFNHYANGAVGDWMYRRIAGIEPTSSGYKTFRVAPLVGGGLTHASGSIKTPYGKIQSAWKIENDTFTIKVYIPVSSSCELIMPSGTKHIVTSGQYTYNESLL